MRFIIPTRQKTELLFSTSTPLGVGGVFTTPVRRVNGYVKVEILAIADKSFGLNVEEAVSVDQHGNGHFVQTDPTVTAALVGGQFVISTTVKPFGNFMKMVFGNLALSSMTRFNVQVLGLPLP